MAKFAIGDWVKITPTPDTKSDVWTSTHNKYCDKIGKIIDINDKYNDMLILRVSVTFKYKLHSISGEYSAWFEDKHLVKTSKWESDRETYLSEKFEEYKKFEKNIKKKRDDMLREIFTDQEEEKRKKLREAKKALNEIREIEEKKDMENLIYGDGWYMTEIEADDDF
jgi:hypothetical protein